MMIKNMKISALTDKNKISAKFRNASKLVTIVNGQQTEESITANNGKELANRINEINPEAFIISFAGPAIRFVDKRITIYQAEAGTELKDALKSYESGGLSEYSNPYPKHSCGCDGKCENCSHS